MNGHLPDVERRAEQDQRKREARALQLLSAGTPRKEVSLVTGCTLEEITRLLRDFPFTPSNRCPQDGCGQHRSAPGRPRHGWVQVKATGTDPLWFCSWEHVRRYVDTQAVR